MKASVKMLDFLSSKCPKILVVGDFMVDNYIWCDANRISPEAPVLIAKSLRQDKRLGGAANVYANLRALGAEVFALGVIGDDESAKFLRSEMKAKFITQKNRKTPLKNRIIAQNQQVLRLDEEDTHNITCENELIAEFKSLARGYDSIILSDYGKGVLTPLVCAKLIEFANELKVPILIDPKGSDYTKYKGATLLTPNKKEAKEALNLDTLNKENLASACKALKTKLKLKYSIITLSQDGIALFDKDLQIIPARAKEVFDVTGAGDSVIAVLAFCLALDMPILKACELANKAAAVVVSKVGSASVSFDEIKNYEKIGFEAKIKALDELKVIVENAKKGGKKVVFSNGCFDILHYGHIKYLEKARNLGDLLIVGLNSDTSVKKLKGESRPINSQFHRACMLAALFFVDFVVIFDDETPLDLIKALRPDILVKGADYKGKKVVGQEYAKLELIAYEEGFSTSKIIEKSRKAK